MISIVKYNSSLKHEWDQFIDQSKNGSFHLKRDFIEYHKDRFEDFSLMSYKNDKIIGVVPGNRTGDVFHSHKGLTYGGIVVECEIYLSQYLELFVAIVKFLKDKDFTTFELKDIPKSYSYMSNDDLLYCMNLAGGKINRTDVLPHIKLSNKLPYQSRRVRSIKKAQKLSLTIQEHRDFSNYWVLLSDLLKEYRTAPVHSLKEISTLQQLFPKNIRLFEIKDKEELLAGVVIFETKNVARAQYIASSSKGKKCGALDCLFSHLILNVYSSKEWFDFGTTTLEGGKKVNLGLSDQKEGFGARTIVQLGFELNISLFNEKKFKLTYT